MPDISRGTREVQSFSAVWATYTQPIEEVEFTITHCGLV